MSRRCRWPASETLNKGGSGRLFNRGVASGRPLSDRLERALRADLDPSNLSAGDSIELDLALHQRISPYAHNRNFDPEAERQPRL